MRKRKRESLHNNEVRVLDTTNWIPFVAKPLKFALDYFEHFQLTNERTKQTNKYSHNHMDKQTSVIETSTLPTRLSTLVML